MSSSLFGCCQSLVESARRRFDGVWGDADLRYTLSRLSLSLSLFQEEFNKKKRERAGLLLFGFPFVVVYFITVIKFGRSSFVFFFWDVKTEEERMGKK